MIEKIVQDWLEDAGFRAWLEMPDPYPGGSFVLIEKTGSTPREPGLSAATLALQSYAPSMYEAAALNQQVKASMEELRGQADICRIRCNSDYNFPDTVRKQYRYQAVFDILYYEEG